MMATASIWPGLTVLKVLDIPVIGRLEVFFLILWMGFGLRPAFTTHMAVSYALTGLWGNKLKHGYSYLVIGLGAVLIGFALIPMNINEISKLNNYIGQLFWAVGIGYPLLCLGTAALRGKVNPLTN